ncbi:MAG: adenine phosphoribosyltransferase [Cyclobacteriaceae bacterium]|nr:adenine phosphoribosyltransferase [Cyclobacteriaceae bacterium]
MPLKEKIKTLIRDVPDFPKPGILFKDITPLLEDPSVVRQIVQEFANHCRNLNVNAVAGIEARGFLFGFLLAQELGVPFIPVRKSGRLPYKKISQSYDLEYGSASIEMHEDALEHGWRVVVHDDLLATGGTANAAGKLIETLGGEVAGFCFVVDLSFLNGLKLLRENYKCEPHYLIQY